MNLNQVTIPVRDIERSVEFYTRLGMTPIVKVSHYARFECPDGDTTFSLYATEEPLQSGIAICFEDENMDERVRELIRSGFEFYELPENKPWLWRQAKLRDPDGHSIMIYHAGENRKNPPWRLK